MASSFILPESFLPLFLLPLRLVFLNFLLRSKFLYRFVLFFKLIQGSFISLLTRKLGLFTMQQLQYLCYYHYYYYYYYYYYHLVWLLSFQLTV